MPASDNSTLVAPMVPSVTLDDDIEVDQGPVSSDEDDTDVVRGVSPGQAKLAALEAMQEVELEATQRVLELLTQNNGA